MVPATNINTTGYGYMGTVEGTHANSFISLGLRLE